MRGVTKDEKLLVSVHRESSDSENDVTIAFQLDEATNNFSEPNETYQNQESLVARIESVVIQILFKNKVKAQESKFMSLGILEGSKRDD